MASGLAPSIKIAMKGNPGAEESQALIRSGSLHERRGDGRSMSIELSTLSIHADTQLTSDGLWSGSGRRGTTAVRELLDLDWHKIPIGEVLRRPSVSRETGLESAQAKRRLQTNGRNVITPPRSNLPRKLLEWIFGGFGSLLLVASIICFIAASESSGLQKKTDLALAIVLIIVLVLQSIFNAWQDYSTSRIMSSIKGMVPSNVLVFRDSARAHIPVQELVAGDLVYISPGDKVPADLRLIEISSDLQFDRSILTGESKTVHGSLSITERDFLETKNVALQGTHCVCGSGMGVVVQTGDKTAFGRIAMLSSQEPLRLTTLQWELLRFVGIIASMAITVAIILVILWAAWLQKNFPKFVTKSSLLINIVSVMVAFIPEGLPIAVTLSLRRIASALKKHGILCKSLSIVETLGSVTVLCSDKTGTLTQNVMRVQSIAVFDNIFNVDTYCSAINAPSSQAIANLAQLASVASICNVAHFGKGPEEKHERGVLGDATDVAILKFADRVISVELARQQWADVHRIDFNSKDKFMLKLSKLTSSSSGDLIGPLAHWDHFTSDSLLLTSKGAPEILLPRCSSVLDPAGGPPIPLSAQVLERITGIQEQWARDGQRVLVLTRRIITGGTVLQGLDQRSKEHADIIDGFHRDLVLVGLVGLVDPPKPDIKETVTTCRNAGIRFFVITGDHPTTAVAIAGHAGIISDTKDLDNVDNLHPTEDIVVKPYDRDDDDHVTRSIVITGPQLLQINAFQMEQLCQYEEIVFARTTPEQKLRIVNEFQVRGNIVAVTGDGVNDAPSLKAAHCGIAMGEGSDIARESADMVLLREFSAILIALEYGRLVFDNLKKTVLYLLPAGSFSELMPILLSVIVGVPQMLSNIQMIIICIATDMLPALSLCMEAPESGLLLRKPRNIKNDRLADWRLLLQAYAFLGLTETLCAMSMSFFYLQTHGVPFSSIILKYEPMSDMEVLYRAQSVYFFTLVLMQWGNLFATRGRTRSIFQHTPGQNLYLFPAAIAALLLGIFFHYVPWFNKVFQTRPLPVEFFFIPVTFGLGLLILDELRKLVVRKYPRSIIAFVAW